jgi:hypothetical protein
VPLSVIGAGFGRTGTKSLKEALETLGFGPCHDMMEVALNRDQLRHWQAAAAGEPVDWAAVFARYRAAVDWPSGHYWRQLADHRRRIAEVQAEILPERLLTFDVAEGWAPLWRFLGVPVPNAPFPHNNSTDAFWQVDRTPR